MAVATRQGNLNMAVNARMYQTWLTYRYSSNVFNEQQQIRISSKINLETYVIMLLILLLFDLLTVLFSKRQSTTIALML